MVFAVEFPRLAVVAQIGRRPSFMTRRLTRGSRIGKATSMRLKKLRSIQSALER